MSLRKSKQSTNKDWGWLHDTDTTSSDDISVNGIGVLAVHLHRLIIDKPFSVDDQQISIDAFRICISAYALSRYSKTRRVYSAEKQGSYVRFDQTMQMIIRIYDKRHDKRHMIHVILYGYLQQEKRYILIADQVIDSIQLVSARHISEAVVFESSSDICLIFQNDIHLPNTVKNQTLFKRMLPPNENNTINGKLYDPSEIDLPIFLKLSFDELNKYVTDDDEQNRYHHRNQSNNIRVAKALSTSPKYSTMTAILDMYSSRKQRLETLFDFLTEGPYLPEQNVIEPTATRLMPWSITYWKRGLAGVPLHGSSLDMNEDHNIENNITHLQNTSPILRQITEQEEHYASLVGNIIKLKILRDLIHRVLLHLSNFLYDQ